MTGWHLHIFRRYELGVNTIGESWAFTGRYFSTASNHIQKPQHFEYYFHPKAIRVFESPTLSQFTRKEIVNIGSRIILTGLAAIQCPPQGEVEVRLVFHILPCCATRIEPLNSFCIKVDALAASHKVPSMYQCLQHHIRSWDLSPLFCTEDPKLPVPQFLFWISTILGQCLIEVLF